MPARNPASSRVAIFSWLHPYFQRCVANMQNILFGNMDVDSDPFADVELPSDSDAPADAQEAVAPGSGKKKRGCNIDENTKKLILAQRSEGKLGYRKIAKMFTAQGLSENAVKSIIQRAATEGPRKKPGRPRKATAAANVGEVASLLDDNPSLGVRDISKETGLARSPARRVIKARLEKKGLRE